MSSNLFGNVQKLGKALMLPIAVLPAAALMLRLGQPDVFNIPFVAQAGGAIFDNLAILFAIGVAVGLSFDSSGAAGLAGAVAYFVLLKAVTTINKDVNMGVLAGMISGISAGILYNKFYNIKLPDFLGFFGGKRFVPIAAAAVSLLLAFVFGYAWPPIQGVIDSAGKWILGAGTLGAFVFGFLNRLLIPFGLHHIINSLAWFVFGSFTNPQNGAVVTGDLNRFFAHDPSAGVFMTGFFPIMMIALPMACLAMYMAAPKENRKLAGGILFSMAFTSFLTGITEPIEFSFMFVAPVLYLFHALMMGASLAICNMLGIQSGFGFSGGFIDYAINWGLSTKPFMIIPIGLAFGVLYYFVFYSVIMAKNLPTPGRFLDAEAVSLPQAQSSGDIVTLAAGYLSALGGPENFEAFGSCITRLRLTVLDESKVDEPALKRLGASGVLRSGKSVQVVVGTKSELIATEIEKMIKTIKR